jgi:hydroxymethylpyrimidine pyrophosphatase-like HAD family hydrolase
MKPQLVALDLDDTLLSPDLSIGALNGDAVRRALAAGVKIVLASGRTIDSMRGYAEELGMRGRDLPIICANGAEVRDVDTEAILRRIALTPHACRMALSALKELGLPAQTYEEGIILVSERNAWTDEDSRLTGLDQRLAEMQKRLAGIATVLISKPCFMEILPPGADKGHALAWVAERYGIARERVMAVGDSGNDIGMLSWAGIACCPADARADVRAITPHIAEKPHEEGAVAELLERFIFRSAG